MYNVRGKRGQDEEFPLLQHRGLQEETYTILKSSILSRRFAAGQKLSVDDLAQKLGVSRTPVKDALTRLAAEGLVTIAPRQGTFVGRLTTRDVEEIFDVRELLELYAARTILALHDVPSLCAELSVHIHGMDLSVTGEAYTNYEAFMDHDRDFHLKIVRASQNRRLVGMYEALNVHVHIARAHYLRQVIGGIQANQEHRAILAAFEAQHWPEVERTLSAHIRNVKTAVAANLETFGGSI